MIILNDLDLFYDKVACYYQCLKLHRNNLEFVLSRENQSLYTCMKGFCLFKKLQKTNKL